ncbi:hypothetical protein CH380_20215 [Leptospira adleri]|uniref:Uncharacterized protein n=1 Tax=Leptospira adleri TaxID=2023186 RepID=A0A2M9YIM7_9LEPT|nr:hypothetical protein CH380_20215 [Leptospira adleri]PJZ63280.1 hypothetical protein CH376_03300 [Leptospira adleri]
MSSIDDSTFLVEFLTKRSSSLFKFLGQGDRNVASTVGLERFSLLRGFLGKRGEFPQTSLHKRSSHFGISFIDFVLITVCNLRISKLCQSRSWETTHSQDWGWHSFLGTDHF